MRFRTQIFSLRSSKSQNKVLYRNVYITYRFVLRLSDLMRHICEVIFCFEVT